VFDVTFVLRPLQERVDVLAQIVSRATLTGVRDLFNFIMFRRVSVLRSFAM
jgi:hypothetical protein